jgi:hypothetical protein
MKMARPKALFDAPDAGAKDIIGMSADLPSVMHA